MIDHVLHTSEQNGQSPDLMELIVERRKEVFISPKNMNYRLGQLYG